MPANNNFEFVFLVSIDREMVRQHSLNCTAGEGSVLGGPVLSDSGSRAEFGRFPREALYRYRKLGIAQTSGMIFTLKLGHWTRKVRHWVESLDGLQQLKESQRAHWPEMRVS